MNIVKLYLIIILKMERITILKSRLNHLQSLVKYFENELNECYEKIGKSKCDIIKKD